MYGSNYKKISENRYRETYGFYYEDFTIGSVIEHRPGRTVTQTDNIWQSLIAMNAHPIHCDSAYASETEFKQLLVASPVTFAIVGGMTVSSLSARAIANLGWDEVRLPHPVFVGDTLYAESEILSKRESRSRPQQGIVTVKTTGSNQNNVVVIHFKRTFMVPTRAFNDHEPANY